MVFRIPLDGWVLSLPVAYACVAFTGLCIHTVYRDPEMTRTPEYYNDEEKVGKAGDGYLHDFKQYFDARVNRGSFGVFNNDFKIAK